MALNPDRDLDPDRDRKNGLKPPFHHSITPSFHLSIPPHPVHPCSIPNSPHQSNTPILHHSIPPPFLIGAHGRLPLLQFTVPFPL